MPTQAESLIEGRFLTKKRRKIVILFENNDLIWDEQELNCLAEMYRDGCTIHEMCKVFQREDPDEIFFALFHLAKIGKIEKLEIGRLKG